MDALSAVMALASVFEGEMVGIGLNELQAVNKTRVARRTVVICFMVYSFFLAIARAA